MTARFQIYPRWNDSRQASDWYWRFKAANNKTQADGGESFPDRQHVCRALERFIMNIIFMYMRIYVEELDIRGNVVKKERWTF